MNIKLALLLSLLDYSSGQNANCDYSQNVYAGQTYYVDNPNYPHNYTADLQCRWILYCVGGYNCQFKCPEFSLPESPSCSMDRLLVSRTGDAQLSGADTYCGMKNGLTIVSTGQRLSIGLITSKSSPGGRFNCQLTAQRATPSRRVATGPSPGQCHCGERRQNRIAGGQETGTNEFPMMAGLVDLIIGAIKCGGVIISQEYVLTAAHCVKGQSVNDFAVIVGAHNIKNPPNSSPTKVYKVTRSNVHPQFTESNNDYDIAIVKTASPMVFSDLVHAACLPFKFGNYTFTGRNVTVLGWGQLFPGGSTSDVLMKVDMTVISQDKCRSQVSSVTPRQMCTYTAGKDACMGDTGGPLLYTDRATGLLFIVGIVGPEQRCASRQPSINTRVTALLNWVRTNTEDSYCVK